MGQHLADIAAIIEKRRGQRELRDPGVGFHHRLLQRGDRVLEIVQDYIKAAQEGGKEKILSLAETDVVREAACPVLTIRT